jgi:hypothetical protein
MQFIIFVRMSFNSQSGVQWMRVKIYGPVFKDQKFLITNSFILSPFFEDLTL